MRATQPDVRTCGAGGSLSAWPTKTYEDSRQPQNRAQNDVIWVWMQVPTTLITSVTGLCGEVCTMAPELPYNWCEGSANCLPTRVEDSLLTTAEVNALESVCGIATHASRRPNTCTPRPVGEVDCGMTSGVGANPAVEGKWPKNLDIVSGRHSGGPTGDPNNRAGAVFNDMAQYEVGATDGVCDVGYTCENGCPCSNNINGCGGMIEDTDCGERKPALK